MHLGHNWAKKYIEKFFPIQRASITDQQVEALHRDVFYDGLIYPTLTVWDKISWFYSCVLNEMLKVNFYKNDMLQFNDCRILNTEHANYPQEMEGRMLHTILKAVIALGGVYGVRQHYYKHFHDKNYVKGKILLDLLVLSNRPSKNYKTKNSFSIKDADVYRGKIWEFADSIQF